MLYSDITPHDVSAMRESLSVISNDLEMPSDVRQALAGKIARLENLCKCAAAKLSELPFEYDWFELHK